MGYKPGLFTYAIGGYIVFKILEHMNNKYAPTMSMEQYLDRSGIDPSVLEQFPDLQHQSPRFRNTNIFDALNHPSNPGYYDPMQNKIVMRKSLTMRRDYGDDSPIPNGFTHKSVIAHELGHANTLGQKGIRYFVDNEITTIELEADIFAAEFLTAVTGDENWGTYILNRRAFAFWNDPEVDHQNTLNLYRAFNGKELIDEAAELKANQQAYKCMSEYSPRALSWDFVVAAQTALDSNCADADDVTKELLTIYAQAKPYKDFDIA